VNRAIPERRTASAAAQRLEVLMLTRRITT